MAALIHQSLLYMHVIIGSLALVVFWLPMLAKKGSKNHKKFGRAFVYGMYAVSLSSFAMAVIVLLDPIAAKAPDRQLSPEAAANLVYNSRVISGFLLMLSVLVFSNTRHSILVLAAKADRHLLKSLPHVGLLVALAVIALVVGGIGWHQGILLLKIFSALSLANAVVMLHYIFKANIKQREWIVAHLGNILGAGIGAYTAFFAFGGSRLFADLLQSHYLLMFWVLPGLIGGIGTAYLGRKYRLQFKITDA